MRRDRLFKVLIYKNKKIKNFINILGGSKSNKTSSNKRKDRGNK